MERGTSNAPLILGIIGAVLMLPALMCSVCVGGLAEGLGGSRGGTTTGLIVGVIPLFTGIIGGAKGKSSPGLSIVLLALSAIFALFGWFLSAFTSLFHLGALICFLIGAIMAKVQKKEQQEF